MSVRLTYTRNTPFEGCTLSPGEIVFIFVLYADTLLSTHQIAHLVEPVYNTVQTTLREGEGVFERGFSLVWERIQAQIDGPKMLHTGRVCSIRVSRSVLKFPPLLADEIPTPTILLLE